MLLPPKSYHDNNMARSFTMTLRFKPTSNFTTMGLVHKKLCPHPLNKCLCTD